MPSPRFPALSLIALLLAPALARPACDVSSGPQTRALVELYTSEGCSSCPPAEQRLDDIPADSPAAVAIALHVPYWDYIGWRDPFSLPMAAERQRWLVRMNGSEAIYTPHVFVSGGELQDWSRDLSPAIAEVRGRPARAAITLHAGSPGGRVLGIDATATAPKSGQPALFLALTEDGLRSSVTRGENAGRRFVHQHVLRQWLGPFAIAGGTLSLRREITLPAGADPGQLSVVGLVQDMASGEVLQAVSADRCLGHPAPGSAG